MPDILGWKLSLHVSQMQWSEVDLDSGVWALPADRTKTRQQRRVFLSSFSLGILK
jgi:integrase